MKAVNPNAQICYDYAMDGNLAPGAGVSGLQTWNDTILSGRRRRHQLRRRPLVPDQRDPSRERPVDHGADRQHPRRRGGGPHRAVYLRPERVLRRWRDQHVADRERLERGAGRRPVRGGERPGVAVVRRAERRLVGRAQLRHSHRRLRHVLVRDQRRARDGHPVPAVLRLSAGASKLAVKGAKVGTLPIATPNIYSYYSDLPGGSYAVMLVNADPANSYQVSTSSLGITSPSETEYTYDAANPSIVSSSFSGRSVSVPAESIVVLTNASGGPPTPTPTPTPRPARLRPRLPRLRPRLPRLRPNSPGSGCQVSWSVVNSWSGGFQLGFTVTNSGTAPTSTGR